MEAAEQAEKEREERAKAEREARGEDALDPAPGGRHRKG